MKKIAFSILLLAGLSQVQAQSISERTALTVAGNFLRNKSGRAANPMAVIQAPAARRGVPAAYYVCAPEDGNGFVVVSGTQDCRPILAYSTESSFDAENMLPEVRYWMKKYQEQLEAIMEKRLAPTPEVSAQWDALEDGVSSSPEVTSQISPLLKTTWNQAPLYNKFCPMSSDGQQAPVGCVATAMAQIMKYWNFPVAGSTHVVDHDNNGDNGVSGTFDAWVGGAYYNWNNMPNMVDETTALAKVDAVAQLSYHCGLAVHMDYGKDESSSYGLDVIAALHDDFGYSYSSDELRIYYLTDTWINKIQNELDTGRPLLYYGGGHAWVCDGYNGDMFHMNWGWGGKYNGYYSMNDLTPKDYDFNAIDEGIILGIQPPGCQAYFEGSLPNTDNLPVSVETTDYIHLTGGTVQSGKVCSINAGTQIILSPGFSALSGCTARFYIEGCNGAVAPSAEDRSEPEKESAETGSVAEVNVSPNPFVTATTITYTLPVEEQVDIQVFDALGALMAQPVRRKLQVAGKHEEILEAGALPPGIYFLVLQLGGEKATRRLVLGK